MSTYSGGVRSVMVTMEVTRAVFQGVCTRNDTYHQESGGRDRERNAATSVAESVLQSQRQLLSQVSQ